MRPARQRSLGFAKLDFANDLSLHQIKLGDGGGIPQGDVSALAIIRDDGGVGKRTRDPLECRNIKAEHNLAVGGIEQNRFVGLMARDEHALFAANSSDADTGGVCDLLEFVTANLSTRKRSAGSERQELLGRNFSFVKCVDSDA